MRSKKNVICDCTDAERSVCIDACRRYLTLSLTIVGALIVIHDNRLTEHFGSVDACRG